MEEPNDWLNAVEIIGKILIFTPVIISLPLIIYAILTGISISFGDAGAGFSTGLMIFSGIIALLYASLKRYKDGINEVKYGNNRK